MRIILSLVLFSLLVVSFPLSAADKDSTKTDKQITLAEALKNGQPVLALFSTTKACNCVMRRCNSAATLVDSLVAGYKDKFVYVKIDLSVTPELGIDYKVMSPPVLIGFDKTGIETKRFYSDSLNGPAIENLMSEISKKSANK